MDMPKLQLESTPARLGLNIQKPVQQIEQPPAQLDIQQPAAILTMSTTKPQLHIDTTEARADVDLMSSIRRTAEVASYSKQKSLDGIGRRAEQGDELMRIENGGSPIVSQAMRWGYQQYSELGINFIPSYGSVKLSFEPGKVDIQAQPQKVINNTKINKPIYQYTPGNVTLEMLQYPSLKIDWQV